MVKCIGIRQKKHRVMEQEGRSILQIGRKIDYLQKDLK